MIKAKTVLEPKPHQINQMKQPPYVYVRNIDGSANAIISLGSMWKQNEIMKKYKREKKQAGYIHKPFLVGDVFVDYFTGDVLILRKTEYKTGHNRPYFEKANKKERQFLSKWIRSVERDLKWRKGSYCENKRRQEWKPYTYTYTSNEEAERRKRDAEYHKKYYEDHKETRQ